MAQSFKNIEDEVLFLERFNNRDCDAFTEVYNLFYDELNHYTSKLYKDTNIESCDALQSVFIDLWQAKRIKFDRIIRIKAYLYISIKNDFKSYITHTKVIDKYSDYILNSNQVDSNNIIESEVYSLVNYLGLLPEDCARIIRLYIEGNNVKEIAVIENLPERTVYHKKQKAISILKNKLPKDKIMILLSII